MFMVNKNLQASRKPDRKHSEVSSDFQSLHHVVVFIIEGLIESRIASDGLIESRIWWISVACDS